MATRVPITINPTFFAHNLVNRPSVEFLNSQAIVSQKTFKVQHYIRKKIKNEKKRLTKLDLYEYPQPGGTREL